MLDVIRGLPPKDRAALASDDPALWLYHGLGVLLNSAQEEEINNVLTMPPGTFHVWRFANRSGKTCAAIFLETFAAWKKHRYQQPDLDAWLGYKYKVLHAAPQNRLMGKAWEAADAIYHGTSTVQQNPLTFKIRKSPLAPLFHAGKSNNPDGSDALWIRCDNGSIVDFLSTSEGAGRMESDSWWLLVWDEFVRQQPVDDIPLLIDQTLLPRSSDFMAPVVLSGTATEDSEPIYAEIEELATANPRYWHFAFYDRSVNFTQSRESIDRQMAVSIDKAAARRSVGGELGEGGRGSLFPTFLLNNAFDRKIEEITTPDPIIPGRLKVPDGHIVVSSFDHALRGDLNVVRSVMVPWPLPQDPNALIGRIRGVSAVDRKSSSTLTPTLQQRFMVDEVERVNARWIVVDASAEGGLGVYRMARETLGRDRVIDCNFSARLPGVKVSNKEFGLQGLQRMLAWGLDAQAEENGWITDWPVINRDFGLLRIPATWLRDRRELAVLRRDDEHQHQDRAMAWVMLAWLISRWVQRRSVKSLSFNIMPQHRRARLPLRRTLSLG